MILRFALVVVAACGRVGFSAPPDGATGSLTIRQTMATLTATNPATLSIGQTGAGDLLVVATSDITSATDAVSSMTDNAGNTFVASTQYVVNGVCIGEVWYAANSNPGATVLSIPNPSLNAREIWFLEVTGARLVSPLDTSAMISNVPQSSPVVSPPVTPSTYPALVIAEINVTGQIQGIASDSAFVPLAFVHGDDAAYQIADAPGTYQATWTAPSSGTYSAATVAFAAEP